MLDNHLINHSDGVLSFIIPCLNRYESYFFCGREDIKVNLDLSIKHMFRRKFNVY